MTFPKLVHAALMSATAMLVLPVAAAGEPARESSSTALDEAFQDPPASARPRVWWHWMNGNVTKDGIAKDLAWMKRVGIAGAQNFDAAMATPQIVAQRLPYMSAEWQDAFRFAAAEADRLGLELAIASSPGFTETGGPWVKPEDGMKKLVWSETEIVAGKAFQARLPSPPTITGPFQSIPADPGGGLTLVGSERPAVAAPFYRDIAVLAWPASARPAAPRVVYRDGTGKSIAAQPLDDEDLTSTASIAPLAKEPPSLSAEYAAPRTVSAMRLYAIGAAGRTFGAAFAPVLEVSDDGRTWREIAKIPVAAIPTTISFAPVTARWFRVVFKRAASAGIPAEYAGIMTRGLELGGTMGAGAAAMMGTGAGAVKLADFRLYDEARVDQAETKAAFAIARDYHALGTPPETGGVPAARVRDLTARMRADGTLDWTPPALPKGKVWRVLRIGHSLLGTMNHPAPVEATGLEVDKFDGAAVRRYMEHYLDMYRQAVGSELIGSRGVRAFLTDSIEAGAANWTPRMIEQFKARRGYDPLPWLPALTGTIVENRARTDAFLYDYRRTLSELMASEHYATVAAVAHEQGLTVYGEAQEDQRPNLGDDMAMRRHTDVPMAALWAFDRKQGPKPTYLADMRGAASVANIYGKPFVAAESFTSLMAPWAFGPRDLKRVVDLEFATGINRPVIHTSVHVPTDDKKPGLTLSMFGQYFNRNESWAELASPWIDYIARNSLLLQQGRTVADVGYYYGEEAPLTALFGETAVADAPKRHAYDFVNADALLAELHNDGNEIATPGGARYRALYLGGSSRHMTLPVLRKLADLVEGGAILVGMKPLANPSLAGDAKDFSTLVGRLWPGVGIAKVGKGMVIPSTDIDAALARIGITPDFSFAGQADSEILHLHRRSDSSDIYFVNNRKDRFETGEARFRVSGKAPELFQPETGQIRPLSFRIEGTETVVPLTLEPDEAVHIVFRRPATAPSLTLPLAATRELATLDGPWKVAFEPGRGAPATAVLPTLAPLDSQPVAGIRYFSGVATYAREFMAPSGWKKGQPLLLDLGEAREVAEVILNGRHAGYAWNPPYRVDVSAQMRPGKNRLQVRVANLWVNRMIGDKQPGAEKITWVTSVSYSAKAPLRRSGLIGPVRLLSPR